MGYIRGYDAKDVTIIVDKVFITGVVDGTFASVEKNENNFVESVGAQGDIQVSEINNPIATLTLTIQEVSPQLPHLKKLSKKKGFIPVIVKHSGEPKTLISATKARVLKPATEEFANEGTDREYEIMLFDFDTVS